MFKNKFKMLLVVIFIAVCFSNNLFAMQESAEKQTDETSLQLKEDAAFIEEFVSAVDDPKVEYDGKTLKLYWDKTSSVKRPLIFMAVCMFLGLGCLLKSVDRHGRMDEALLAFGILCTSLGLMSEAYIFMDVIINSKLTPFLAIDSEQIETRNNIKMKWTDASIMKFLNDNSIMFCNKDGIPLFVIDNNNLPIKLSELIVILGFYLKKYGAKGMDSDVQK